MIWSVSCQISNLEGIRQLRTRPFYRPSTFSIDVVKELHIVPVQLRRRAYQIYPDDPSRVATIIYYHSLPSWLLVVLPYSCGFFFSSTSSSCVLTHESDEKNEKVQKLFLDLVVVNVDELVCLFEAWVRMRDVLYRMELFLLAFFFFFLQLSYKVFSSDTRCSCTHVLLYFLYTTYE